MIVRRISIIMFICGTVGETKLAQQARVDKQSEGAINRGAADASARGLQLGDEFVGVEVFVRVKNMTNQDTPRLGQLFAANLEEFAELAFGTVRNRKRF